MTRMKMDLSGKWTFQLDKEKAGMEKKYFEKTLEDTIILPGTTSEQKKGEKSEARETGYLTEPYHFEGYAWYTKRIDIHEECIGKMAILKLERTRISTVWLNGRLAGSCDSFCTSHSYDVSDYIKEGTNTVTIMVSNTDYKAPGGHMTSPDTQTNWNGILGELSLNIYDEVRIQDLQCYPDFEERKVGIDLEIVCQKKTEDAVIEILLRKMNASNVEEETIYKEQSKVSLCKGTKYVHFDMLISPIKTIELWNEYTRNLYDVTINVRTGNVQDTKTERIGFRNLHTKGRCFYLNDLQIMLRGKHDGLLFPLTGYAPMDKESWIKTFRIVKEYGINHYRFHTCCPPEAAFEAADEEGIYLEPELPFWGTIYEKKEPEYDGERQAYLEKEGFAILKEFGNHPSFLMFSLGNELWGSKPIINELLGKYKKEDPRHFYTQGANNHQFVPSVLENDDFYIGVRLSTERLFRGSYAMCDAPQGHVQVNEPEMIHNYDEIIAPKESKEEKLQTGERQIQYQTGVKTVKMEEAEELIPQIPVISHEVGQYETFPDFNEIEKYTGVLKAENLAVFKERMQEKGLLQYAKKFFESSGALAVQCYKRELETAFRSKELSGFQLLDIQDYTGQGTALVGILNSLMENKGLIEAREWRRFCSDQVLMLSFSKFIYEAGEDFTYQILFSNMNPEPLSIHKIKVKIFNATENKLLMEQATDVEVTGQSRLFSCGSEMIKLPMFTQPEKLKVLVEVEGTSIKNQYEIYVYPKIQVEEKKDIIITEDKVEMITAAKAGKKVLFFGSNIRGEKTIQGTYCTDFWCYPMFASISESIGKPKPIGTMGMYIEKAHNAFDLFPTDSFTTPQWWKIVNDTPLAVLDHTKIKPIVWMIDNFERNHKIGVIYEANVENGIVLFCQANLKKGTSLEEKWLYQSLLSYMTTQQFDPEDSLNVNVIDALYK